MSGLAETPNTRSELLISYFRSGWAFLIPYLAAYLLYAWLKWPVNPVSGEVLAKGVSESVEALTSRLSTLSPQRSTVPSLLHVYWFLHGLHVILGAIALCAWWRKPARSTLNSQLSTPIGPSPRDRFWPLVPWLLLALVFWIPGTYLEWPADPWEHFRRTTEWATQSVIGSHSAGYKSFYFFAYSLMATANPVAQWSQLEIYTTVLSLLLAWQYYRLAKAAGFDERWAFISVLANILWFGNSSFSFYRYYAIASTMYSQLGAVALTRIVLEAANCPQTTLRNFFRLSTPSALVTARHLRVSLFVPLVASPLLLVLIAANHVQGIGIAGLSIVSIVVCRFLRGNSSRIWWLCGCTAGLGVATFLWWPHQPAIDSVYRPAGWLTSWYGFNFAWPSPATDRAMQILGVFGLVNLAAGVILLSRNHVIGWMTVGPVIALALPIIALPFANRLAAKSIGEIVTFHRMLFAIPSGIALIYCLRRLMTRLGVWGRGAFIQIQFGAIAIITMAFVSLTPGHPFYNRLWHLLSATPHDLRPTDIAVAEETTTGPSAHTTNSRLIATDASANILRTLSPRAFPFRERPVNEPVAKSLKQTVALILSSRPTTHTKLQFLNRDPAANDHTAWTSLAGYSPNFITGIQDYCAGSTALQNPAGHSSEVFTSYLIPISPEKTYCLEMSLKQTSDTQATAYLAVAWYDDKDGLLVANRPRPEGAGYPLGWANGTYSYFGLYDSVAPTDWTTYRISFGKGQPSSIPREAKSLRIGALLNYNRTAGAEVQLTNVRFWEKEDSALIADGIFPHDQNISIFVPNPRTLITHASQAAQLSNHWFAQQLPSDLSGSAELRAAAQATGRVLIDTEYTHIDLQPLQNLK